jgi:hypothetical protein
MVDVKDDIRKVSGLSREARFYALKELARRAGVGRDFFQSWTIDFQDQETTIHLSAGTDKRIRFKTAPPQFWSDLTEGCFHTTRALWMHPPPEPLMRLIPDFVIPFSCVEQNGLRPVFVPIGPDCVQCHADLPASALLMLSRFEEMLTTERDIHGRFAAAMSVAFRDGFLDRPVVDEYGLALEQALTHLLPTWRPIKRALRVKLSHDIDGVGLPFRFVHALGHTIRRRKPLATLRDLLGGPLGLRPTYLECVRRIVLLSLERGLDSAVYWKGSPPSPWDTGYDPRHPQVQEMISWLDEHGIETGVHPGYEAFNAPDRLQQELQILRKALGEKPLGGRQHYLRWCPDTWQHWETCGLVYDSTVGYADQVGFRTGSCFPYRPWLLSLNREADLIEIPLIVMDRTPVQYMGLGLSQSLDLILRCLARCRSVGGVFTLLWHNDTLVDPRYGDLYRRLLDALVGHERFDWKDGSEDFY